MRGLGEPGAVARAGVGLVVRMEPCRSTARRPQSPHQLSQGSRAMVRLACG